MSLSVVNEVVIRESRLSVIACLLSRRSNGSVEEPRYAKRMLDARESRSSNLSAYRRYSIIKGSRATA